MAASLLVAVTDHQGSTSALIDRSQNVAAKYGYTPYGTSSPSGRAAAGNRFRWIGAQQLNDVHGTYLTGYRQHDPYTARFTQPDPNPRVRWCRRGLSWHCGQRLGQLFLMVTIKGCV